MLGIVQRTADARAALKHDLATIGNAEDPKIVITIDGQRQDTTMVALVRPVIAGELRGRIHSLERDLEAQGVVLGD